MEYILKDGTKIKSIPIGKTTIQIGEINQEGLLTVCDRAPNKPLDRKARVICKCACGNYTVLNYQEFKNNTTKSCGCYSRQRAAERCRKVGQTRYFKDYTKIYNPFYTFIKPTTYNEELQSMNWIIKCNKCGKEFEEVPSQIISLVRRRGNNPCDCWKFVSKGAKKIEDILTQNNILFEKEKTFDTCISDKNNFLRFDYYLPDYNILIEYDGEQHFAPTNFGSKTESILDRFETQKKYDKIKNEWCKNNNICLIRIPYSHYNEIELKDLLTDSKFIERNKNGKS